MKPKKSFVGKVVQIDWRDAMSKGRWENVESYRKWSEEYERTLSHSWGKVVYQSKKSICVIQSNTRYPDGYDSVTDSILIPLSCCTKIKEIK